MIEVISICLIKFGLLVFWDLIQAANVDGALNRHMMNTQECSILKAPDACRSQVILNR